MLTFDALTFKSIDQIPAGNLIYVLRDKDAPTLALRIEHPAGGSEPAPFAAALILIDTVKERRMPLVDTTHRTNRCIDWGVRPTLLWDPPLELSPRNEKPPETGYLLLAGEQLLITSLDAGGEGTKRYWDLKSGAAVELGGHPGVAIVKWRLGVAGSDGAFQQLAAYPKDYFPERVA